MTALALAAVGVALAAVAAAVLFGLKVSAADGRTRDAVAAQVRALAERDAAILQANVSAALASAAAATARRGSARIKLLEGDLNDLYDELGTCGDPVLVRTRLSRLLERSRARGIVSPDPPRPDAAGVPHLGAAGDAGAGHP